MPALAYTKQLLVQRSRLLWWQWGHVIGLWLGVMMVLLTLSGIHCPALLLAIAGHLAGDYTLQDNWMFVGKVKRQIVPLICHAIIAGGLAGLPFGPVGCLVSIVAHLGIDATNKFGLGSNGIIGPITDQLAHLVVILALVQWG